LSRSPEIVKVINAKAPGRKLPAGTKPASNKKMVWKPKNPPPSAKPEPKPSLRQPQPWADIIRNKIKADGWSSYALGLRAGVDPSIVLRFVTGERHIRLETAEKLCTHLRLGLVPVQLEE
jgi:hypothetical protein